MENLPDTQVVVHGISISPGKPTILAQSGLKALWGLPGHAVSAMVVFIVVVRPFFQYLAGMSLDSTQVFHLTARLTRNLASVQGRVDYVRVRLKEKEGELWAEPVLGKSGLIRTMVEADGLIAIDLNQEGLEKGTRVRVYPI
jgi:molybdopterin molybdotransferase